MGLSDPTAALLAHMARNGFRPRNIIWDGEPHRFPGRNQKRGSNGWYVAFPDQLGAVYGDWRDDPDKYHWRADGAALSRDRLTGAHQAARAEHEERQKRLEARRAEKQAAVAAECQRKWDAADMHLPENFPYLKNKGFTTVPAVRFADKNGERHMIVPVYELGSKKIQSLQWIAANGTKRFHPGARAKGGRCPIFSEADSPDSKGRFYVCEGLATALSIHRATECPVVITFSAGNLKRVTLHYRRKYPDAELVVCADNDRYSANGKGKHNPGVTAARAAVKAAEAIAPQAITRMAVPDFESQEGNPTDFNDLDQREGPEAVLRWLEAGMAERANTRAPPPSDKLQLAGTSVADLKQALDHYGIEARFDLRGQAIRYRMTHPPGDYPTDTWIPIDDRLEAAVQEQIRSGCVNMSTNRPPGFIKSWSRLVNAILAERQVDPFEEYLASRPPWDGEPRLDRLLCDLFGADGNDLLVAWAGTYIFLGVVQRTKRPGCKLREIPVLIGPQRCGKSALLRNIFPGTHRDTWYGGDLNLADGAKRRVESTLRRALVELSEMVGAKRASMGALKSFLTLEDDGGTRLSYDRRPTNLPRRCAFVGTSNEPHILPADPTGNTRFVAITLNHGCHVEAFLNNEVTVDGMDDPCTVRDQLWAEALHLYTRGDRANLRRDLYHLQGEANLEATTRPEELQNAVADLDKSKRYTYREVATELQLLPIHARSGTADYSQLGRQRKNIREALTANGWQHKRIRRNRKLPYCWVHPDREAAGAA